MLEWLPSDIYSWFVPGVFLGIVAFAFAIPKKDRTEITIAAAFFSALLLFAVLRFVPWFVIVVAPFPSDAPNADMVNASVSALATVLGYASWFALGASVFPGLMSVKNYVKRFTSRKEQASS